MTSPELLPKHGEKPQKHERAPSDTSTSGAYTISVSSNGRTGAEVPEDDLYIQGSMAGVLPGWGAGWVVERHPRPNGTMRVESIKLQDVGKLLK
jgi:PHS family inorganic phosphate transporter-like MFS transporter